MNFPKHMSLYIEHNDYKCAYESVHDELRRIDVNCWISNEERELALKTGEVWSIQWYPDTPIGSHLYYASSLSALLEYVNTRFV